MAKLYTLLNTNHKYDHCVDEVLTQYSFSSAAINSARVYELREPYPCHDDGNNTGSYQEYMRALLTQTTALCNDMDDLFALHLRYYESVEDMFNWDQRAAENKCDEHSASSKLSMYPRWLNERDSAVLETVHQLQQSLRLMCQKLNER